MFQIACLSVYGLFVESVCVLLALLLNLLKPNS
jgi:hypothetical protein